MSHRRLKIAARSIAGVGTGLALMLAVVSAVAAAPAPNNCDGTGTVAVQLLAIQSAQNATMMAQLDGSYSRTLRVRVYCTGDQDPPNDIGEVVNAQVAFWIDLRSGVDPNLEIFVDGKLATNPNDPILIDAPLGIADINVRSTDPDILDIENGVWRTALGRSNVRVSQAFGVNIPSSEAPFMSGSLYAQTPELGSLALFGAGAAGMAGYALTRLRAGAGRRQRQ